MHYGYLVSYYMRMDSNMNNHNWSNSFHSNTVNNNDDRMENIHSMSNMESIHS